MEKCKKENHRYTGLHHSSAQLEWHSFFQTYPMECAEKVCGDEEERDPCQKATISILVTANILSWIITNRQERPGKVHCKEFMSRHLSPIKSCHAPTNESLEGLSAHKDVISSLPALRKLDEKSTVSRNYINSTASTLLCLSLLITGLAIIILLCSLCWLITYITLMQIRCLWNYKGHFMPCFPI